MPDTGPMITRWMGRVPYEVAEARMTDQMRRRHAGEVHDELWLLEHPPVLTLGRRGTRTHLLASPETLTARGVEVHTTRRGGDITYHGPGQLVGYPIVGLRGLGLGPRAFVEALEGALIELLGTYGIAATRRNGCTGVWTDSEKIAAIGVEITRGVTGHGFALNVTTDLSYFDLIVPCGIPNAGVTSIEKRTGARPALEVVAAEFAESFAARVGRESSLREESEWAATSK